MKNPLLLVAAVLALAACHPEEVNTVPLVGSDCGTEGHRVTATVDGDDQCLSTNVMAVASPDGALLINGLAVNGNAVTLQVDSMAEGDFPIDEVNNAVLWMETGTSFLSTNDDPGVLTILWHDAGAHRASGTFHVVVHHAEDPFTHELGGSFDVTYTVE